MVSAVTAALTVFRGVGLARIVCRGRHLRPRPFGQDREEARVRGNLAGVLGAEITTEAWIGKGNRRELVIEAGKSHKFTVPEEELPH
jgi:hypothetical protein